MISLIRGFLGSKLGMLVALIFVGLIGFAFAGMDVSNTGMFGGVSGSDRVAIVGEERISTSELQTNINLEVESQRQRSPGLSREAFVAAGGFEQVLDQMVERLAIAEFARSLGLRAGKRLVDSELAQMSQFHNASGEFDQNVYRTALNQFGYTDAMMRRYIGEGMLQQQAYAPVVLNSRMPESLVRRYAALQHEHRRGEIATLPSAAYAPTTDPSAEQLQAYYQANRSDYIRPERRILRYAAYGEDALKANITPTEAEIAARYERDSDQYRAAELRNLETLIVPLASGQAQANAIRAEVAAGKSLDQAARERSLSVNRGRPMEQDEVANRDSAAVAAAAFATPQGGLTQPVRGRLGFYIVRVAGIDQKAGRSLAQVRQEIVDQLTAEKRREALLDLSSSIEDSISDGANLVEIADAFGLTIQTTPPIIGTGQVYGGTGAAVPPGLMPIVPTAFALEEGQTQIDELQTGTAFVVYDVGDIINSAPAPLKEIEATVKLAWRQTEGLKAAQAAADRIAARLGQGQSMAAALSAEKVPLPAVTPVDMNRSELSNMQRVAAPLALLFSMAKGTVKKLELGNKAGWVVTKLDDIEVGDLAENDPELVRVGEQLHRILADEQAWSFTRAVKDEVGVELNDATVQALKTQLGGTGS